MGEQKKTKPIVVTLPQSAKEQSSNMENFKLVFDANASTREELLKRAINLKGGAEDKVGLIAKFFATNFCLDFGSNSNLYTFKLTDSLGDIDLAMAPVHMGRYFLKSSRFATAENKQWYKKIKETLPVELSPNVYLTEHGKSVTFAQEMSYLCTMLGLQNEIVKCGKKRLFNKESEKYEQTELFVNKIKIKTADGFETIVVDISTTITELDALACRTREKIMASLVTKA